ncbi:MAG: CBS domain-containing protein [Bacteroidia bacterium]|nr:CBS domain-containing protein [Bacteroidia bacterium]MDW8089158.1 CBS domain-containing protein [Bacteroidia bacterium]
MKRPSLAVLPLRRYPQAFVSSQASVRSARQLFRRYPHLSHLPVVSAEGKYLGLLSRKALGGASPDTSVGDLPLASVPPLLPYATIYDALQYMESYKTLAIPIQDEEGRYLGLITAGGLVQWWSRIAAVREPGTVLILETYLRDYSLAEIARILEGEEIRILSAYLLSPTGDYQKIFIVLKVNTIYLTRALELLERRGYKVVAIHGDLLMEKHARDQLQALLRYLNL